MSARYELADEAEYWWCKVHQRRATHICIFEDGSREHHCAPGLGGITIPCSCEQRAVGWTEIKYHLTEVGGGWAWRSEGGSQSGPVFYSEKLAQEWAEEVCKGLHVKVTS